MESEFRSQERIGDEAGGAARSVRDLNDQLAQIKVYLNGMYEDEYVTWRPDAAVAV